MSGGKPPIPWRGRARGRAKNGVSRSARFRRALIEMSFPVLLAVEGEAGFPAFSLGFHMDRPFPQALKVDQGIPRKIPFEVPALVLVREEKFSPVVEVHIHRPDDGLT